MFFNKNSDIAKCFLNMVDIHNGIMPNENNGTYSVSDSLQMLSYCETLGVRKIIITPHIGVYSIHNTTSTISEEFEKLKDKYKGKIELSLGAKYMLDCDFLNHLKSGNLLTLFENYILVDMHKTDRLEDVIDLISSAIAAGYIVVLAHPENYPLLSKADYLNLKNMGVLFQMNILSVSNYYGKRRREKAIYLLKNSLYDFVGSNMHSLSNYSKALRNTSISSSIVKRIERLKSNKLLDII